MSPKGRTEAGLGIFVTESCCCCFHCWCGCCCCCCFQCRCGCCCCKNSLDLCKFCRNCYPFITSYFKHFELWTKYEFYSHPYCKQQTTTIPTRATITLITRNNVYSITRYNRTLTLKDGDDKCCKININICQKLVLKCQFNMF